MQILNTVSQVREFKNSLISNSVGFVPTMGALHDGHMALVQAAKENNEHVIVSIFVNPKQFGANEDLTTYPRTLDEDLAFLEKLGVDAVFTPSAHEFYPNGFSTSISMQGPALGLESDYRPDFFSGVCIVVAKLLCTVMPNRAYFGEKDYQQLCVVAQMVRDLNLPIYIISCPTVRKTSGLALSSRNVYLSDEDFAHAPTLYATLKDCARKIASGKHAVEVLHHGKSNLKHHKFAVDYLELRHSITLAPVDLSLPITTACRLLVAAKLGTTRLIDNIAVNPILK